MRLGVCWEQETSEHRISATAGGVSVGGVLWPTPLASIGDNSTKRLLPKTDRSTYAVTLAGVAGSVFNRLHSLPSPETLTDGSDGSPMVDLNPAFVATLMGLPADWLNN